MIKFYIKDGFFYIDKQIIPAGSCYLVHNEDSTSIAIKNIADRTFIVSMTKITDFVDELGFPYANITDILNHIGDFFISPSTTKSGVVDLATNALGRDAWGRPKVINDYSLFSALWTYSVPNRKWLQYNNTGTGLIEQSFIDNNLVKSENGHLVVTSNNITDVYLRSKRHPRYQANRGLLYSTALIIPNPNFVGTREFGFFNLENGVFFRIVGDGTSYKLYVVRRYYEDGVVVDSQVDITSALPVGFDISKGHVYDIQLQWRGVGNIFIYIDLKIIYVFELLGTLTGLSVTNPALNVSFNCYNATNTDELKLIAGCVDVTSEGGYTENKMYSSISTGTTLLPTKKAGKALLAVRLPEKINYNGYQTLYTRDLLLTELTTFCKDECVRGLYFSRIKNTPNLNALTGWLLNDSFYEYRTNADDLLDIAFQSDKTNMVLGYATRGEKDISIAHDNPDPTGSSIFFAAGDIIVIEFKSDGISTGGCTLEFSEEV